MKTQLKWIPFLAAALALVGVLVFANFSPATSAPALQLTPAVDPMSTPTVVAPTLDTQNGLPGHIYGSGMMGTGTGGAQMDCPMMSGTMEAANMTGMTGMSGVTGMSGMSGMNGMNSMSGSMSGSMTMGGVMNIDDAITSSQAGILGNNPWWLVGWIVVFIILIGLVVLLVLGIIWMIRRIRSQKPAASA